MFSTARAFSGFTILMRETVDRRVGGVTVSILYHRGVPHVIAVRLVLYGPIRFDSGEGSRQHARRSRALGSKRLASAEERWSSCLDACSFCFCCSSADCGCCCPPCPPPPPNPQGRA
jgi:hypothetical protein